MSWHFANEALEKTSDGRLAVWPVTFAVATDQIVAIWSVTATRQLCHWPEFGGIGKMKEGPRIRGHSNNQFFCS